MIHHSKPLLGKEEEEAAVRVIRSAQVAQGVECAALESDLEAYLSVDHVVVVSSGSAALHLALVTLGKESGDRIGIPSYVCSALLNAIRHVDGLPHLFDLPKGGFNIDLKNVDRDLDAIIVPHMFGQAVSGLDEPSCLVIEDCAMSIGASAGSRKLGTLGALGVFSFYATKVLCAGEGGAICTDDAGLAEHVRDIRDYDGRTDSATRYNYKMTEIQAAIARVQLRSLDTFVSIRREIANRYTEALRDHPVVLPRFSAGDIPFRFVIRHHEKDADSLIEAFEQRGVAARKPVFCPLHRIVGHKDEAYPNTSRAFREAVSIPLYPALTEPEIRHVIDTARDVL